MLKITEDFLSECKGLAFYPCYTEDSGFFVDDQRFNWWIDIAPGRARKAVLVNSARDDKPVPRATCEALIAATVATADGGVVLSDGGIADLDDDLNLTRRS